MTGLVLPRRRLLAGLIGLMAAPAIVRASSLMPVRAHDFSLPFTETYQDTLEIYGEDVLSDGVALQSMAHPPGTMTFNISYAVTWIGPGGIEVEGPCEIDLGDLNPDALIQQEVEIFGSSQDRKFRMVRRG